MLANKLCLWIHRDTVGLSASDTSGLCKPSQEARGSFRSARFASVRGEAAVAGPLAPVHEETLASHTHAGTLANNCFTSYFQMIQLIFV